MTIDPLLFIFSILFMFIFGLVIGALAFIGYAWRWLQQDPDGPGGFRNRLQQLGSEADDKK